MTLVDHVAHDGRWGRWARRRLGCAGLCKRGAAWLAGVGAAGPGLAAAGAGEGGSVTSSLVGPTATGGSASGSAVYAVALRPGSALVAADGPCFAADAAACPALSGSG